ncbi:hypothetical protein RDABS01_018276, partial [Bienertia sinuspersici]
HPIARMTQVEEIMNQVDQQQEKLGNQENCVKIEMDEIQPELDYWQSSIYCQILGANPPLNVADGYFRRIRKNHGVDKGLMTVPIWIHLHTHYKYWGMQTLSKLTRDVGKKLGVDQANANREKLAYARCKVDVNVAQAFPDQVTFLDQRNQRQIAAITYEWRPTKCNNYKAIGHATGQCRREGKKPSQQWRPKEIHSNAEKNGVKSNPQSTVDVHQGNREEYVEEAGQKQNSQNHQKGETESKVGDYSWQ